MHDRVRRVVRLDDGLRVARAGPPPPTAAAGGCGAPVGIASVGLLVALTAGTAPGAITLLTGARLAGRPALGTPGCLVGPGLAVAGSAALTPATTAAAAPGAAARLAVALAGGLGRGVTVPALGVSRAGRPASRSAASADVRRLEDDHRRLEADRRRLGGAGRRRAARRRTARRETGRRGAGRRCLRRRR
jgi:hypothetical protein